jgi:hypothetical protein
MHDCRGSSQVDAKVLDETSYPMHMLYISLGIESTASGSHGLEQSPLFVPPQRALVDAAACRDDRNRVSRLVSRIILEDPIGHGNAKSLGPFSLRHQDDRSCRIVRSSS